MFTANLHKGDRFARLILGLVLVSLVFIGPETPFGYIGIILIITAFINFCPIYRMLGFSSRSEE